MVQTMAKLLNKRGLFVGVQSLVSSRKSVVSLHDRDGGLTVCAKMISFPSQRYTRASVIAEARKKKQAIAYNEYIRKLRSQNILTTRKRASDLPDVPDCGVQPNYCDNMVTFDVGHEIGWLYDERVEIIEGDIAEYKQIMGGELYKGNIEKQNYEDNTYEIRDSQRTLWKVPFAQIAWSQGQCKYSDEEQKSIALGGTMANTPTRCQVATRSYHERRPCRYMGYWYWAPKCHRVDEEEHNMDMFLIRDIEHVCNVCKKVLKAGTEFYRCVRHNHNRCQYNCGRQKVLGPRFWDSEKQNLEDSIGELPVNWRTQVVDWKTILEEQKLGKYTQQFEEQEYDDMRAWYELNEKVEELIGEEEAIEIWRSDILNIPFIKNQDKFEDRFFDEGREVQVPMI